MANRYAVADGLWSNTSTWDGGTLPASTDNVYANNYDVSIDQDVTVLSLSNDGSLAGYTDGGSFKFVDGYTVSGDIYCGGTEHCIISDSGVLNSPINIYGDISFSTAGSVVNTNAIYFSSRTGILNIVGDITTVNNSVRCTGVGFYNNYGDSTLTISGNLVGADRGTAVKLHGSYCDLNLFGNSTGGQTTSSEQGRGLEVTNSSGNYNITGDLTGGGPAATYSSAAIFSYSLGTLNFTGNLTGGNSNFSNQSYDKFGLYLTNCSLTTTITGNITGGSVNAYAHGAHIVANQGDLTVNGNINPIPDVGAGLYAQLNTGDFTLNGTSQGTQTQYGYGFDVSCGGNIYINGACRGGGLTTSIRYTWGGRINGNNTGNVTSIGEHKGGGGNGYSYNSSNGWGLNNDGLKIGYCSGIYHSGDLISDVSNSNTSNQGNSCLAVNYCPDNSLIDIIGTVSGNQYGSRRRGFNVYNTSTYVNINFHNDIFDGAYLNGATYNYGAAIFSSLQNSGIINIPKSLHCAGGNYASPLIVYKHIVNISGDIVGTRNLGSTYSNGAYFDRCSGVTINGDVYGGISNNNYNKGVYISYAVGDHIINGDVHAGSGSSQNYGVNGYYNGTYEPRDLNIYGNVYNNHASNAMYLDRIYGMNVNISGDIISYGADTNENIYVNNRHASATQGNTTIRGDIIHRGTAESIIATTKKFDFYGDVVTSGTWQHFNITSDYLDFDCYLYEYDKNKNNYTFALALYESGDIKVRNAEYIFPYDYTLFNFGNTNGEYNISGNFKGSDISNAAYAFYLNPQANPSFNFYGNYKPGNAAEAIHALYRNHKIKVYGTLFGSDQDLSNVHRPAFYAAGSLWGGSPTQTPLFSKCISGPSGQSPFSFSQNYANFGFIDSLDSSLSCSYENVDSLVLTVESGAFSYPPPSAVKEGVSYKNGTTTGTMKVPAPENVSFGIPVENTYGTAVLTTGAVASLFQSSISPLESGVLYNSGLLEDIPTIQDFEARTIPSGDYFDPTVDTVARVTLVDTTTDVTNIDFSNVATSGQIEALNNFDPASDTVARVTLVDTTTDVTNIDLSNVATSGQIESLNNFDPANDTVARVTLVDTTTDVTNIDLSNVATSGQIEALNNFDPANDTVARVTLVDTTTDVTNIDLSNVATSGQIEALNNFDPTSDTVARVTLVDTTTDVTNIDLSNVATSGQIEALNNFDPASDTVARVTLVDTTTDVTNIDLSNVATSGQVVNLESSLISRTIPSGDYFDPAVDTVARVTLVDTTTDVTNIDLSNVATSGQIAALHDFDPSNDTVARVTLVDTTTDVTNIDLSDVATSGQIVDLNSTVISRTIPSGDYFDPSIDVVANVSLVDTTTDLTNIDFSSLALESSMQQAISGIVYSSGLIEDIPTSQEFQNRTLPSGEYHQESSEVTVSTITQSAVEDIWSTYTLPESYATAGTQGTPAQILYFMQQTFSEFGISGVTISVKRLDGSSTAAEFLLDNSLMPTTRSRIS